MSERRFHIRVCRGPECGDRHGSPAIYAAFKASVERHAMSARVDLGWQSCFGRCSQAVNVLVREVTPESGSAPLSARRATALYNAFDVAQVEPLVACLAE